MSLVQLSGKALQRLLLGPAAVNLRGIKKPPDWVGWGLRIQAQCAVKAKAESLADPHFGRALMLAARDTRQTNIGPTINERIQSEYKARLAGWLLYK